LVVKVIGLLPAQSALTVILSEVSNANEVEGYRNSFAPAKPVPVLWVGVLGGSIFFTEFLTQDTRFDFSFRSTPTPCPSAPLPVLLRSLSLSRERASAPGARG
jgi:hypothetical protein